jgi:bifunctional UDP-N-acetylglucosamine pyrophosphorylase/glucosamine-1-phosphate N-acetyltransferase
MKSRTPKVLHSLGGRTLLAHALHAAGGLAPEHLLAVVGHERAQVSAAVQAVVTQLGRPIGCTVQTEQNGTGHAMQCALRELPSELQGTIVVTYADVPLLDTDTLQALLAGHEDRGAAVTVLTTDLSDPTGYGRVLRGNDGEVLGIVEHKDATTEQLAVSEVNSGVYAFDAAVLRTALGRLTTDNAQGELYLTDVLRDARADGHPVGALTTADEWLVAGVNDKVQLAQLGAELNRRVLQRWMRAGVTVIDPATTWVDVTVELAPDVILRPGVQLHGETRVSAGAEIGPDSTLTDVIVGADATVIRTHGSGAVIGAGATVGPFAYLRRGTVLGDGGKIGTFVETKNASIGAGSKVPHLTYVGDATIGEHSNIGASSVFVNYDGVHKNRTEVGSHVRTGSDTMFIAPVRVGDGAYTGAGTVVSVDVPPGALAVSGGRQRNIEGWVQDKRPGTAAAQAATEATTNPEDGEAR